MEALLDTLAEGRLLLPCCQACGTFHAPPRLACPTCGSAEIRRVETSRNGIVYAVTTVHRAPTASFAALVPYDLVVVEMVCGVRLMGHGGGGVAIGDPVVATFSDDQSMRVLRFLKASDDRP